MSELERTLFADATPSIAESGFGGALLKVWRDRVSGADGSRSVRKYIAIPARWSWWRLSGRWCSAAVPLSLQRAFQLPAGKIDAGRDILACALTRLRPD